VSDIRVGDRVRFKDGVPREGIPDTFVVVETDGQVVYFMVADGYSACTLVENVERIVPAEPPLTWLERVAFGEPW
jgi:hypothetical protein